MGYSERVELYKQLEIKRNSKVIVYITGDKPNYETRIHQEVLNFFIKHLDIIQNSNTISLYLYTRGGDTLAARSLIQLIRQFCQILEIIVPFKAHSAGTLMCLGADKIIMTKQATLGPIDPTVNTPLNPSIPGAPVNITFPVNVESIKGYIEFVKKEFGVNRSQDLASIIDSLTNKIHPLVLGEVYRARSQIKMLANKLLNKQVKNKKDREKIIHFLCSESGSHDYTINRNEAKDELNLNIEKPNDELYKLINNIYEDIQEELELTTKLNSNLELESKDYHEYSIKRALIESKDGGCHYFVTEGKFFKSQVDDKILINDQKTFEGWKHE